MGSKSSRMSAFSARKARGAAVVEFAFVFPILFLLIYGTIVYSYVFVINESIHYAAKTAAESAIRVDPQSATYNDDVVRIARRTACTSLDWMPLSQLGRFSNSDCGSAEEGASNGLGTVTLEAVDGESVVRVVLDFDVSESIPAIFPIINLPLVGPVPPLPARMRASAIALI